MICKLFFKPSSSTLSSSLTILNNRVVGIHDPLEYVSKGTNEKITND